MDNDKRNVIVKNEIKEILIKRGISIADLIKRGYDEKKHSVFVNIIRI